MKKNKNNVRKNDKTVTPSNQTSTTDDILKTKITETVDAGSLCWKPKPSDQVFDTEAAIKVADKITEEARQEMRNNIGILTQEELEKVKQELEEEKKKKRDYVGDEKTTGEFVKPLPELKQIVKPVEKVEECKKLLNNFAVNLKTNFAPIKYEMSYDGSLFLMTYVTLNGNKFIKSRCLPIEDFEKISELGKHDENLIVDYFDLEYTNKKDFKLIFTKKKSTVITLEKKDDNKSEIVDEEPGISYEDLEEIISELQNETDEGFVKDSGDVNVTVNEKDQTTKEIIFLNTVAHPEGTQTNPFEKLSKLKTIFTTTEVPKESIDIGAGLKVPVSGIEFATGRKFQKRDEEKQPSYQQKQYVGTPEIVKTTNANAYEIRLDLIKEARNWLSNVPMEKWDSSYYSGDAVLDMAKKFYSFVENKKGQ